MTVNKTTTNRNKNMSLPTVITLVDLAAAPAQLEFALAKLLPNGRMYTTPSPNDDLIGYGTLRAESSRTKKNIERTVLAMSVPRWDSTRGVYDGFYSVNIQLNRPASAPLAEVRFYLEQLLSVGRDTPEMATVREALISGQVG